MYPKWLVFVLTLLSCVFLMASAAPVSGRNNAPVKRLRQFQVRRPSPSHDRIVARGDAVKRNDPPPTPPQPSPPVKRS